MSGIWLSRNELISTIGEIVGYKSGLAITRSELAMLVPSAYVPLWRGKLDAIIRVRPEEIGEIVGSALHSVGNTPTASVIFPGIRQWHKYRNDPISRAVVVEILGLLPVFLEKAREAAISGGRKIDPTPFLDDAEKIHGAKGREIALELLKDLELYQHQDPFSDFRRVAWRDLAELQDLFSSESLDTFYGTFIDQRYIDYLAKNFKAVDGIN
jgi:restriction system protein